MHDARVMQQGELIGSREACRLLSIDKSTLSRWVEAGRVPLVQKLPGANGAMLFDRSAIDRVISTRTAA